MVPKLGSVGMVRPTELNSQIKAKRQKYKIENRHAGHMMVACLVADREALTTIFSNPIKFYNADPFTFLFASLLILIFGPGLLSPDATIAS